MTAFVADELFALARLVGPVRVGKAADGESDPSVDGLFVWGPGAEGVIETVTLSVPNEPPVTSRGGGVSGG
jgi:hypothetical protein